MEIEEQEQPEEEELFEPNAPFEEDVEPTIEEMPRNESSTDLEA